MEPQLSRTKFLIPLPPSTRIPRPHLVRQLEEGVHAGHKLSLVTAPTGSGKTTLLSEWAHSSHSTGVNFCWLSLDEKDDDPVRFWTCLFTALETHISGLGETVRTMLQGDPLRPVPTEQILTFLINSLIEEKHHFVLFIDDYHVIHDEHINAGLIFLLNRMPSQLHLAIASRSEPSLDLASLRAHRLLTELRLDRLSFTQDEAKSLLKSVLQLDLTTDEVTTLETRTEGWVAGLQLAGIAMQAISHSAGDDRSGITEFIQAFGGSHRHIVDYLTSEVLKRQPEDIQIFLRGTSTLERLSAPLCDAVLERTGSRQTLEYLERANLFLIPLDSERNWYRYHSLWADVLRNLQQLEDAKWGRDLHRRASTWFEENGFLSESIHHALLAGEPNRAATLLEPQARFMTMRGEAGVLMNWLEQLPAEVISERPELILSQGWARIINGQFDDIELLLKKMPSDQTSDPAILGELAAIRAIVATVRQDIPTIQEEAELALKFLPDQDCTTRVALTLGLGTAAVLSGDSHRAIELLNQAILASQSNHQTILQLVAKSTLAQAYESLGLLDQAQHFHMDVISFEDDPVIGKLPLIGLGYVGLGGILHERLEFEQADSLLQKGLEIGRRWGSPEIQIGGLFSMARLRYTQGRLSEALTILDGLETEFLNTAPLHERDHILAIKARIWLVQGEIIKANAWVKTYEPDEGDETINFDEESRTLVWARILISRGETARAARRLAVLEQNVRACRRDGSLLELLVVKTLANLSLGNSSAAMAALEEALIMGETQNQRRVFVDEAALFPPLQAFLSQHNGNTYVTDLVKAMEARESTMRGPPTLLSEREIVVLHLIEAGHSNQEIANRLVVALSTVKSHVKSILHKLNAENRTQAVARGRELKIL